MILGSRTPEECITGRTPDISKFAYFSWSQWVWYKEPTSFPEANMRLGKWMGIANDVGQAMTYWVLIDKGTIIARSSVSPLLDIDTRNPNVQCQMDDFNKSCYTSRGTQNTSPMDIFPEVMDKSEVKDYATPEADTFTPEAYDEYLLAQVVLPVGGELRRGQVARRLQDHNGNPVGICNSNPLMDTREYEVTFPNGSVNSYLANTIVENIYLQVDQEGRNFTLLSEIIDHEEDLVVTKGDLPHHTTRGWRLLVSWKDGTTTYVPLREMNNSVPEEAAENAVANKIDTKPAFIWWVPYVMRKRSRLICKVKKGKTKYWHRTNKYGIELPKSVDEALEIDRRTGTAF